MAITWPSVTSWRTGLGTRHDEFSFDATDCDRYQHSTKHKLESLLANHARIPLVAQSPLGSLQRIAQFNPIRFLMATEEEEWERWH